MPDWAAMTSPFPPVLRMVDTKVEMERPFELMTRPFMVDDALVAFNLAVLMPPTKVEVADDVATKYWAPMVGASMPPEKVEVADEPTAMATVVVGASSPPALISHDLPKSEEAER